MTGRTPDGSRCLSDKQNGTAREATRTHLQKINEDLETSNEELVAANEELQSINEELRSANEELETSREETQSLNEELSTVNSELQAKVEQLDRANDDMNNLLESTEVAAIFLNKQLEVLRFTERATHLVHLIETDLGRPLRDLTSTLQYSGLIAENPLRYRRQVLALKQFFARQQCTVLFITDRSGEGHDMELQSIAHGVISVERNSSDYGPMKRRLQVIKQRGRDFQGGFHDLQIRHGGLQVYPRLIAAEHGKVYPRQSVPSGLKSLDALLGGGLAKGTSTLVVGASGTGKSALSTQYAAAAAERGEHPAVYLFDENVATFQERSTGLGMDVRQLVESGKMTLRQVNPGALSPGEFAHNVRCAVEEDEAGLVVLDSLNGYISAMPNERFLTLHLHELLTYLGNKGVTTMLLLAQHGMIGSALEGPIDASYLADTVLLLRYFESMGEVRQAISVIKKRTGRHERTIRELRLQDGVAVGQPLREFQGVLSGSPQLVGSQLGRSEPK